MATLEAYGKELIGSFGTLDSMAGDAYSTSKTYNKGDFCIYNNALQECNTDNTTGTWDGSKWDIVSIGDKLTEINSDLSELDSKINEKIVIPKSSYSTVRASLIALYPLVDRSRLTHRASMQINGLILRITHPSGNNWGCIEAFSDGTNNIFGLYFDDSTQHWMQTTIAGATVTTANIVDSTLQTDLILYYG